VTLTKMRVFFGQKSSRRHSHILYGCVLVKSSMSRSRLEVDCAKHGQTRALPLIEGQVALREKWPESQLLLESYPRICVRCLAEAMVSPVRRAA
jgi:hypothetical protein